MRAFCKPLRWWKDDCRESHEDETEYSLRQDERYLGLIKSPEPDEPPSDHTLDGLLKIWYRNIAKYPYEDEFEDWELELGEPMLLVSDDITSPNMAIETYCNTFQ